MDCPSKKFVCEIIVKPQLNSTQHNITKVGFAPPSHPLQKLNVSNISAVTDLILMVHLEHIGKCSLVPVGRRSVGRLAMTLVATINDFFFFSSFLRHLLFSWKQCSDQKTYLANVDGSAKKLRGSHLSRSCPPFWGPLTAILNFAGGAAFFLFIVRQY